MFYFIRLFLYFSYIFKKPGVKFVKKIADQAHFSKCCSSLPVLKVKRIESYNYMYLECKYCFMSSSHHHIDHKNLEQTIDACLISWNLFSQSYICTTNTVPCIFCLYEVGIPMKLKGDCLCGNTGKAIDLIVHYEDEFHKNRETLEKLNEKNLILEQQINRLNKRIKSND